MDNTSQVLSDYNRASRRDASATELSQLATHDHPYVQSAVASHRNTPTTTLRSLQARTAHVEVHVALIGSPHADRDLLGFYAGTDWLNESAIRAALSKQPKTPWSVRASYIGVWLRSVLNHPDLHA